VSAPGEPPAAPARAPLAVAISGASGLIGGALATLLAAEGHRILRLQRGPAAGAPGPDEIPWDPDTGQIAADRLEGVDAVVHLAGASVAKRWSAERRRLIRDSRVNGTALLARTLAGLSRPPAVWLSASAVGYYGERGDEPIDESAPPAQDFLGEVATAWEAAAQPAAARGVRVAHPRFGVVLSPAGGALAELLPLFRRGAGGRLGSGKQVMSWVALPDAVAALRHALLDDRIVGPFNVTAPHAVTNAEFTQALGRVLARPTLLPVPGFAVAAVFGAMGKSVLLGGARVLPRRLEETGFRFRHPDLEPALRALLRAPAAARPDSGS
jgi:uncharacterized protein (TIGR01777 family)